MTTKNKAFRRILTLTLAFVLALTGMGIGSWGVDEAWADDDNVYMIDMSEHNTAIGTFVANGNEYPVYEVNIDGTRYNSFQIKMRTVTEDATYPWPMNVYTATTKGESGTASNGVLSFSETTIAAAKSFYSTEKENIKFNNTTRNDNSESTYLFFRVRAGKAGPKQKDVGYLIISISKEELDIDETAVRGKIKEAESLIESNFYIGTKQYNGKAYSKSGFWSDMQVALHEAKALFTDNDPEKERLETVTDKQLAAAYSGLKTSMEALIPITEANTTVLYEALRDCLKTDERFSYNTENFATFTEKKTTAETLLASLFADGKATEVNTPAKQDEIDRAAAELRDSYSGDKMTAEIRTQEALTNFLTKAGSGVKGRLLNDLTLIGYETVSSFSGELDGNGHTITVDSAYTGLVGTNNGTIRGLTVDGADLVSVSAICSTNHGLIENCHNAANFSNDADGNNKQKGALCNINDTTGIIRGCYNTGKLSGTYVSGICGGNWGLVENCFNTGLIDAETEAGGIVWRNHNNVSGVNAKSGVIRNCYNFNVMHHTAGWDQFYGSYIQKNLGPICGDNEKASVNAQMGIKDVENEGTVENGLYLDTVLSDKPNGRSLSVALSDIYSAQKADYTDWRGHKAGPAIAGWDEPTTGTSIFEYDTTYYVFYDKTNDHFIAVTFDDAATSAVIDAAKPSEQSELCTSAAGAEKEFYLVKVPTETKAVTFKNTETIIDYANGYTNRYVKAYQQLDNFGVNFTPELSRKFVGTAIGSSNVSTILNTVSSICGSDTETVAFVKEMLSGIEAQGSTVTPTEKDIKVKFRFVGATKSPSGNYDAKTNKDSQYVTWIATRTYSLKDGSSVGDLLKLAIKESGIKTVGEENNYVSGVYAPNVLGNYYLAEFTNGTRSGWMYTVNGKHPGVGLNGYYLKDGDSVIWHYINDYSYECSDWFDDDGFPQLGDASTWDPWLKVPDVDPTKDTPTIGVGDDVSNVTTDTKTGTTTAPTDVKVSEKTAADGTKEKVAEVKVSADNQKEILKQAKDSKSSEIILVVSKNDVKDATKAELTLDKSFLESIVKDTDAKLTIKTPFGDKTYTQDELKALIAGASGTTVTLTIEKSDELDEAAKLEKAKELTASLSLTARSAKTAKKNVKISLKLTKASAAAIAELQDMGYTVKYKFYRSTKKVSKYAAKLTKTSKTYLNTSGAKDSKYYYKARVMVYDQDGKLVTYSKLTQCKYAARTWTK